MKAKKITREEKLSDAFLVLGSQYYSLARYSAENFYTPIAATLFHHSLEMILKGFLIKKITLEELKADSHSLTNLWEKYKTYNPIILPNDPNIIGTDEEDTQPNQLSNFDPVITNLDKVEKLRYPVSMVENGFRLNIKINTAIPLVLPGTKKFPAYEVDVTQIDSIVLEIFKSCNVPPYAYLNNAPQELRNTLPGEFISDKEKHI